VAKIICDDFFNRDAQIVACALLGKIIRHRVENLWLSARIIETESYYLEEKGSHASLGYTEKRRALFAPPGTIYMYYARGGDSLNFSVRGEGNAILIKSGFPHLDQHSGEDALAMMQRLNPDRSGHPRPPEKLCAGQTLLCKSLGLKVREWDARQLDRQCLILEDTGHRPSSIIQTTRLGIPQGRDEHLPYRFIDADDARHCTQSPLRRGQVEGQHYQIRSAQTGQGTGFFA